MGHITELCNCEMCKAFKEQEKLKNKIKKVVDKDKLIVRKSVIIGATAWEDRN